jgi:hypothetical protein
MKTLRKRGFGLALLLTLGFPGSPVHAGQTQRLPTQEGSGVEIEMTQAFEVLPLRGVMPVRVKISNPSGARRTWRVDSVAQNGGHNGSTTRWGTSLSVDPQQVREFDLRVPLANPTSVRGQRSLQLTWTGYGLPSPHTVTDRHFPHQGGSEASIALSQDFALAHKSRLENFFSQRKEPFQVNVLRPADYRADPMAYAGLDVLWITEREWRVLPPREALAFVQWVSLGGRLHVVVSGDRSLGDLPYFPLPPGQNQRITGWGRVEIHRDSPGGDALLQTFADASRGSLWPLDDPSWPDRALAGLQAQGLISHSEDASSRQGKNWIFGLVIGFALLLGPFNLLYARRRRRPGMVLWTTPALSVGASLLLILFITLRDGFGGQGFRRALVFLLPDSGHLAVVQEQVAKTGVLFRPEFALPANVSLVTVVSGAELQPGLSVQHRDGRVAGGHFASRTLQAQVLQRVEPTRSKVEISPAAEGGYAVLSSVNALFNRLFYHDEQGGWWQAAEVGTGERQRMQSAAEADFAAALKEYLEKGGRTEGTHVPPPLNSPLRGHFYGFARSSGDLFTPTLDDIRWVEDHALWIGPVTRAGGSP